MDTSPSVLSHVVPLLSGTHSTVVSFEYQQLFKFSTTHSTSVYVINIMIQYNMDFTNMLVH